MHKKQTHQGCCGTVPQATGCHSFVGVCTSKLQLKENTLLLIKNIFNSPTIEKFRIKAIKSSFVLDVVLDHERLPVFVVPDSSVFVQHSHHLDDSSGWHFYSSVLVCKTQFLWKVINASDLTRTRLDGSGWVMVHALPHSHAGQVNLHQIVVLVVFALFLFWSWYFLVYFVVAVSLWFQVTFLPHALPPPPIGYLLRPNVSYLCLVVFPPPCVYSLSSP